MLRCAIALCLISVNSAHAGGEEIVATFQRFCTQQPLTFDAVDAMATAMQLPVREDKREPPTGQLRWRSKWWLVSLEGGAYELSAGETQSADSAAVSCAITATKIDGNEMRQALIGALALGTPSLDIAASDGEPQVIAWNYGADAVLWFSGETQAKPAVHLQLVRSLH